MRIVAPVIGFAIMATLGFSVSAQEPAAPQGRAGGRGSVPGGGRQLVWAPKAVKPGGWTGVHKPHTKLPDRLAKNKAQAAWREPMVDNNTRQGDYISMPLGRKHPNGLKT